MHRGTNSADYAHDAGILCSRGISAIEDAQSKEIVMPNTDFHLQVWDQRNATTNIMNCTISIDPANVAGLFSAFGASLWLPYSVAWYPSALVDQGATLLSLEGWISAQNDQANAKGIQIPMQTAVPHGGLAVPLTVQHIEAIEEQRRGDVVVLKLQFAGLAVLPNPRVQASYTTLTSLGEPSGDTIEKRQDLYRISMQGDTSLRIERERWLFVLEQLGAGKRRLVELPQVTTDNLAVQWDQCGRALYDATLSFRRGEYEQAIAWCRKVVEGVATVLASAWNIQRPQNGQFERWTQAIQQRLANSWPGDKNSTIALSSLLFAAWTYSSPSHHYGLGIPLREEASLTLAFTADLLGLGGLLLRAHPEPVSSREFEAPTSGE